MSLPTLPSQPVSTTCRDHPANIKQTGPFLPDWAFLFYRTSAASAASSARASQPFDFIADDLPNHFFQCWSN